MREKIYQKLNRWYGILMGVSFWGGILPLVPFLISLILGGESGEKIAVFLYQKYYPVVIAMASLTILLGLVAMYIGGKEGLSAKTLNKGK